MARRYPKIANLPLRSISPDLAALAFTKLAPCDRDDGFKLMTPEARVVAFENEQEEMGDEGCMLDTRPEAAPIGVCPECAALYQYIGDDAHCCAAINAESQAAARDEWYMHGDPD